MKQDAGTSRLFEAVVHTVVKSWVIELLSACPEGCEVTYRAGKDTHSVGVYNGGNWASFTGLVDNSGCVLKTRIYYKGSSTEIVTTQGMNTEQFSKELENHISFIQQNIMKIKGETT